MSDFATLNDVITMWRAVTPEEQTRIEALLPVISDGLRQEAIKVGKNLDEMIVENPVLANVAKGVTIDILSRTINTSTTAEPMSQMSQSALGYTVSGTYLVAGGGTLQILKNDLKKLGLLRQRVGIIDL